MRAGPSACVVRFATLLVSLCLGSALQAGTLLFLNSQPGDYIGQGQVVQLGPGDGTFTATRTFDNGVGITFNGSALGEFWSLDFAAPMGAPLTPGAYEGATRYPFQAASAPGLDVSGDGRGCNMSTGRFVVLEATYGGGGDVQSFAADLEQHCEGAVPALLGSVRYHAGDAACAGQAEGTGCDDHDACSAGDACEVGMCTGAGNGGCEDNRCRTGALCDPSVGVCIGGATLSCDDGDICTDDTCDVSQGCISTSIPCWSVAGRTTIAGLGGIRDVPPTTRFTSALVLRGDGAYRLTNTGLTSCATGIPDEVGTTTKHRGRLVLAPTNLDEISAAASACIGYPLAMKRYHSVVKLSRSSRRLHGTSKLVATLEVLGQSIGFHAAAQFSGTQRP
jgi:hypothetical protein